jgi:hypothetical protein
MAAAVMTAELLLSARPTAILNLIKPLLPNPPKAQVRRVGRGIASVTFGILPHGMAATPAVNPEDPRVPSRLTGLFLNYYETWRAADRDVDLFHLHQAYMHVHIKTGGTARDRQVLSLHCDPSMPESEAHFAYKRGPHVHVEGAEPRIDRAHISLCVADPARGGDNISALTEHLRASVRMVAAELFPCWESALAGRLPRVD